MAKRLNEKKPTRRSALEFEGTLRVNMLTPGPVLSVPYWTNNRKKPCEAQSKGRNRCWKDASRSSEHELEKYSQAACAKKKGVFEEAPKRTMDTGRVELDFLSEAQAKRLGVRPGPIMRFCHEVDQPGTLLPVLSPLEVQAKATDFNARIARFLPDIARRSAREIAGPDAPLGGLRRGGGSFSGLLSGGLQGRTTSTWRTRVGDRISATVTYNDDYLFSHREEWDPKKSKMVPRYVLTWTTGGNVHVGEYKTPGAAKRAAALHAAEHGKRVK